MFIVELFYHNGNFALSRPLKLTYLEKSYFLWQKNWAPFISDDTLLLSYTLHPHEVIYPNLLTGECYLSYKTFGTINWKWGTLRGGTPAQLVDGEYLAFFHSSSSTDSPNGYTWTYYMGAYTFSVEPPYQITHISAKPIISPEFYSSSEAIKKVIFPGGFVDADPFIYIAYGRDDHEIWIATIDKKALKKSLIPVAQ